VLAATMFAHDSAALRVHVSASLGVDGWPEWLAWLVAFPVADD
jgi:hypothetical protein